MSESLDPQLARQIVDNGVRRYIAARHGKVPQFVDDMYTLAGSLRLHRHAIGFDMLRAPTNVLLVLPVVLANLSAFGLARTGAPRAAKWLRDRQWFLRTDVGREIEWRMFSELLELPIRQDERATRHDALAAEIMADPELSEHLREMLTEHADLLRTPRAREQLEAALSAYTDTRAAASELTNAFVLMGTGAAAMHKLTPGVLSFGPALAGVATQHAAIAGFPLGATLGGLWYGAFPAQPAVWAVASSTVGMLLLLSCVAAFTGIVADPVQRRLGLHQRRLHRFLDTLERNLLGEHAHFAPRDYYVTRVIDIVDLARAVLRQLH